MTPAQADFVDSAPLRIDTVLSLRQAPDEVWDVLVDTEHLPEWFRSCSAARVTSEAPHGVGSTRWVNVDMFKVNHRIIVSEKPKQWGFTTLDANLPVADTVVELVTLDPDGNGTKLTYSFAIALKPWLRPLTSVFRWRFTQLFESSLAGLQPYLDEVAE
jgi:uncharacterized protein YndB with AHSA1/START domain